MRWTRDYQSDNVEDRRAAGPMQAGGPGGIGILFWLFSRFGLPGVLVGGALLYFAGGLNLGGGEDAGSRVSDPAGEQRATGGADDPEREAVSFVSFVLDDVQKSWSAQFGILEQRYVPAQMVLFRGRTRSACGMGQSAMGPFYCPSDSKVYIDLSFYRELRQRLGAPGDFAQAYVIAHEVGHHVQHLLGLDERGGSVKMELQADCLAGVWGHSAESRNLLEVGDLEEALNAAAAIGDDKLQRDATGTVRPETFTHGSSAQRVAAFKTGFSSGSFAACK
ncbi:MAG TPA: neutral zinc metallopeptidase [Polyangiales bacterium]|nr:neutral zinc metallopeptidase [Polyangiales bacterium]